MKMVKYKDGMLVLGQKYIFCGSIVVDFGVMYPTESVYFQLPVASHMTEQGLLLPNRLL